MDDPMRKTFSKIVGFALPIIMIVGCGSQGQRDYYEFATQNADSLKPLLVYIGGWNSCSLNSIDRQSSPYGMSSYPNFLQLHRELRQLSGRIPRYVLACQTARGNIYYYTTSDPTTLIQAKDVESLLTTIQHEQQLARGPTILLGHSHGGWIAMQAVLNLPRTIPFYKLTTIDAISRELCSPSNIVGIYQASWQMPELQFANPDCLIAPRDISNTERNYIRTRVRRWQNDFQTQSQFLHSSAIAQAHDNLRHTFEDDNSWFSYRSHIEISTAEPLWSRVNGFLRASPW